MCHSTNLVPWVALAVSVASLCFAGAAWWTSREKLRLDLYTRRFDVYSRTLDFYHAILEWSPADPGKTSASLQESSELRKAQTAFIKASRESQFLFDDDSGVHKRLEKMHDDTMGIIGYKRDLAPALNGPDLVRANQEFTERWKRVHASIPLLEKGMKKYLDFHSISACW